YNVLGKMVTEGTFKESIDTSILSKGLYLLRVEDKEVLKLIKS
ncbi:T9SS C-terminal target domain-containing protein, partial [Aquimarina sp. BL5]